MNGPNSRTRAWLSVATNVVLLLVLLALLTFVVTDRLEGRSASSAPITGMIKDWETHFTKPPSRGLRESAVHVVEFLDYECPFCRQLEHSMQEYDFDPKSNPSVSLSLYHFPLDSHPLAYDAAVAAECARRQGKFVQYHEGLFSLGELTTNEVLIELAAELPIGDLEAFRTCLQERETSQAVEEDLRLGKQLGLRAVPAVIVNGEIHYGVTRRDQLEELVERASTPR